MTDEQVILTARLNEILADTPELADVERRDRIVSDLVSGDDDAKASATDEVYELWLEVMYVMAEKSLRLSDEHSEDSMLSLIAERLLNALRLLNFTYQNLDLDIPSFRGLLFTGDPKSARKAIRHIMNVIKIAVERLRRIRMERYASPEP